MDTVVGVLVLALAAGIIWLNVKLHDPEARKRARAEAAAAKSAADSQIVCQFCGSAGGVATQRVQRKKGISGGKATGGVLTGGASLLFTGLSRIEGARRLRCSRCGMEWDVA